jgi:hypothetical protein
MFRLSPFAYAQYQPKSKLDLRTGKFRDHIHFIRYGDGQRAEQISEDELLEMADELREQVLICNEDRHNGHGISHTKEEADEAFKAAVQMLINHDYDREWVTLQKDIHDFKQWGGHKPKLVLFPDEHDPRDWNVLIPGDGLDAEVRRLTDKQLKEILPPPQHGRNAWKTQKGWRSKKPKD